MYSFLLSYIKVHGADKVEASSVAVPVNIGTYMYGKPKVSLSTWETGCLEWQLTRKWKQFCFGSKCT